MSTISISSSNPVITNFILLSKRSTRLSAGSIQKHHGWPLTVADSLYIWGSLSLGSLSCDLGFVFPHVAGLVHLRHVVVYSVATKTTALVHLW